MRLIISDLSVIIAVVLIKICNTTTSVNYDEYCPDGYNRILGTPICILITKNSSYANQCLKSGSTPTTYYAEMIEGHSQVIRNYLVAEKIEEVWLPIKKNSNHFLVWDLPGPMKQNGRVTEISLENTPTEYSSAECIVYNNKVQKINLEYCDRIYRLMCLADTRESFVVPYGLCDSKFIGRLSKYHDLCFTITDYGVGNPATINSNDTFVLVDQLIGQLNKQNEAILVYDPLSLSPDSSAFKLGSIKIIDKHSATKQVVQKQHNTTKIPSINIAFNSINSRLIVFLTNYESLWNPKNSEIPFWCYNESDLNGDSEVTSQYTVLESSETSKIFGTRLSNRELGFSTIWCEGQMLKSFETIQSKRLIIEYNKNDNRDFILCAKLKQNCNPPPCKLVTELEKFNTNVTAIKDTRFGEFKVIEVQTKQILSLDQNSITLLLHFVLHFYDADFPNKIHGFETGISKFIADDSKLTEIQLNNCGLINNYLPSPKLNETTLYEPRCYNSHGSVPSNECAKQLIRDANLREMYTSIHNELEKGRVGTEARNHQMLEEINKRGREAFELMNAPSRSFVNLQDIRLGRKNFDNFAEPTQSIISDRKLDGISGDPNTNTFDKTIEPQTEFLKINDRNTTLETIDKLATRFINSNAFESKVMLGDDGVRIMQINNFILVFVIVVDYIIAELNVIIYARF